MSVLRLFFGQIPAGGPFSDSVTETATATDTPSAVQAFAVSRLEDAAAVETPSSSLVSAAAVTEIATAQDYPEPFAWATYYPSITETAVADEEPDADKTTEASASEAGTATESISAIGVFSPSITETASATEVSSYPEAAVEVPPVAVTIQRKTIPMVPLPVPDRSFPSDVFQRAIDGQAKILRQQVRDSERELALHEQAIRQKMALMEEEADEDHEIAVMEIERQRQQLRQNRSDISRMQNRLRLEAARERKAELAKRKRRKVK